MRVKSKDLVLSFVGIRKGLVIAVSMFDFTTSSPALCSLLQ